MDLYKEIIIRNPKKVGYSGLRQGLGESLPACKQGSHRTCGLVPVLLGDLDSLSLKDYAYAVCTTTGTNTQTAPEVRVGSIY